ncbi:hypothetical protein GTZ97_13065 [Aquabacterium fontiphilum]|uniref:Mov34/MPN/PAD-1 family protein n=1 Tax=Aquabacterium fontiphilum TaxID=450365 RepID=UPI001377304D|nr:hypothetical protein [Aquabacterium fontiphilum]
MLRITVPPDVRKRLESALAKAGPLECGGVLLGEHVGVNHFVVRRLTIHGTGAIASFVRNLTGVVAAVKDFCMAHGGRFEKFNYLGEWHSHPLFSLQPSGRDHDTMRSIVMDKSVGANFAVLLIFRLDGQELRGSAHTYLPDGAVHPSELELEPAR